jgi:site-specific DNA recombinase
MGIRKAAGRRAAIANRVSRVKGASIPEQDADNTEWCETEGVVIVERYEEEGSASRYAKRDRKEWPRLIADLREGLFDLVVLWESSRGDRTLASWVQFLDLCLERDVLIHVTSEGRTYNMANSSEYNQMAQAGINNREESEKTSKRMNRVVRNLALKGAPGGKCPWSYRREYEFVPDPDTGRQIRIVHQLPDEVKGPLTDEMATRALAGEPLSEIARNVQARIGGKWDGRRVREILLNPTIAGLRVHQGEVVGDALWAPVLASGDRDAAKVKFARLEAKLKDPSRRTFVDGAVKHLLTGVVQCGHGGDLDWPAAITTDQFETLCGSQFRWNMNGKVASYECRAAWHVTCAESLADEMVEEVVILRLAQPDAREVFVRPDVSGDVAKAKAELATLQLRLKGFYGQAAKGKISDMGIAEIEAELLPEIAKLEKRARPLVVTPLVEKLITSGDVRGYWTSLLVPQKREVIRAIVTPVILPVGRAATKPVPERVKFFWNGTEK